MAKAKKYAAIKAISARFGFSYQRICNWMRRGVPAAVQLRHPEMVSLVRQIEKGE